MQKSSQCLFMVPIWFIYDSSRFDVKKCNYNSYTVLTHDSFSVLVCPDVELITIGWTKVGDCTNSFTILSQFLYSSGDKCSRCCTGLTKVY